MKVEATYVVMRCTPEEAFDHYANGERYPEWMTGTKHMRMLTPCCRRHGGGFVPAMPAAGQMPFQADPLVF